jgi:predicted protein tyrosine phosphatase
MMLSPLFVVSGPWRGRLAIAPAPAPGPNLEKNLRHWNRLGVTAIVSMLRPNERPGWEKEEAICRSLEMNFYSIPILDHSIPQPDEMPAIAARLVEIEARLKMGAKVVTHCFAGIGRSGMVTISLLMLGGVPLDDAMSLVSSARGLPTPETEEQREWLRGFDRYRRLS